MLFPPNANSRARITAISCTFGVVFKDIREVSLHVLELRVETTGGPSTQCVRILTYINLFHVPHVIKSAKIDMSLYGNKTNTAKITTDTK